MYNEPRYGGAPPLSMPRHIGLGFPGRVIGVLPSRRAPPDISAFMRGRTLIGTSSAPPPPKKAAPPKVKTKPASPVPVADAPLVTTGPLVTTTSGAPGQAPQFTYVPGPESAPTAPLLDLNYGDAPAEGSGFGMVEVGLGAALAALIALAWQRKGGR